MVKRSHQIIQDLIFTVIAAFRMQTVRQIKTVIISIITTILALLIIMVVALVLIIPI